MRLDLIARLTAAASIEDKRRRSSARRPAALLPSVFGMVVLVLGLVGCNTGSVGDARRSQRSDAGEPAQLSAQQATRTAERFFQTTVTPSPDPPLAPTLETLVITLGVGPDGAPSGSYLSVPADAGVVYAAARLGDVRAGQVVSAAWTDAFGNVVGSSAVEIPADAPAQWIALPLQLHGALGSGDYAVFIFGDETAIGSLSFTLSGPGSGAQLLPDLPSNPQARASGGSDSERRQENQGSQGGQQQNQDWNQQSEGTWQDSGQQSQGTWQESEDTWQEDQGTWQEQQNFAPQTGDSSQPPSWNPQNVPAQ